MALPNTLKLFIDPKNNLAYPSFDSGTAISNIGFYAGDTTNLELFLIDNTTADRSYLSFPAGSTVKVAVGDIDTPPSGGTFTLTFGANTTSALAYNISAADLQTALNNLASINSAGGVTVSLIGNNYAIAFNNVGSRTDLTANGAGLIPLSNAGLTVIQQGTSSLPEITLLHLQTLVAGYTNTFSPAGAPSISISTIQSWNGQYVSYKVKLLNSYSGSFQLTYNSSSLSYPRTAILKLNFTESEIKEKFGDFSGYIPYRGQSDDLATAIKYSDNSFDIYFTAQPSSSGLVGSVSGIGSNPGLTGDLSLNTTGAISLLGGSTAVQTSLAVQVVNDGKSQTVYQTPCVLYATVIDEGVIAPAGLDTYVTLSQADTRYMPASSTSGFTFADATTQTTAAYSKAYVDASLLTKTQADGYYQAAGTALLRNGSSTMAGNLNMGGYNIVGTGTCAATLGSFTTVSATNISAGSSFTVGGTSGMTYGSTGITFTDATVQTTAYTGSSTLLLRTNNLSDLTSASSARSNLGLGTMATETASSYVLKSGNLSGLTDYSTARNNLGLGSLAVYADAPADSNYYVRRNNAWVQAVVFTSGTGTNAKNYLTI